MANGEHPPSCPAYNTPADVKKYQRPYCTCKEFTMNQEQHKAAAEALLEQGIEVVGKLRKLSDLRKNLTDQAGDLDPWDVVAHARADKRFEALSQLMDERGKQAVGIWAQAQVHATLATIPDPFPMSPPPTGPGVAQANPVRRSFPRGISVTDIGPSGHPEVHSD